jgi:hypothetical protein
MANSRTGNKLYVDTGSAQVTTSPTVVVGIFFTPSASNDAIILQDTSSSGTSLKVQWNTAKQTQFFNLTDCPLMFANGIYVASVDTGAVATLIIKG